MIHFLAIDEVLAIHEQLIERYGGRMGIYSFPPLHSAIERPRASFGGGDLYPTIFAKASALIQSLILNHPFDDGNKRTAITACSLFLEINGWKVTFPEKDSIQFTLDIDAHKLSFDQTAAWLKKHSKK